MGDNVDQYGLPIETAVTTVTTVPLIGKRKTFAGLLAIEWIFLLVSVINILTTLGLTSYRLYEVVSTGQSESPDFTFCILLLVNGSFCIFYVVNGLLREQEFEIYAFTAAIISVLLYCVLEYSVNSSGRDDIKLARLIVICIMGPLNIGLAIAVARQFGWLEFKIVGASEILQVMYEEVCRFTSFLRFDFQIAASMVILVLQNGTKVEEIDIIILSVGLPVCFLWMVFGLILVRKEWKWAVWIFAIIGLLEPAYVIFKIYWVYDMLNTSGVSKKTMEMVLQYAILSVGAIALLVRSVVLYELYRVSKNFNEGLRERAFDNREIAERTSLLQSSRSARLSRSYHT